jgi:lipoprotein signal peptidase
MPAAGIYALQSVICILIAVAIVFNTKWYYVILLSLAFLGGFFNIIDRAANHGYVIDYLPTGGTTSNFADVFILIGIIGFGVIYIIMSIIAVVNEKKEAKVEQPTSDNPSAPKVD